MPNPAPESKSMEDLQIEMLKSKDHWHWTRSENIPMPKVMGHILLLKRTNENTEPTVRPK